MNCQPRNNGALLVIGGVLGIIITAVLITPLCGFTPVLSVVGVLFVASIVIRALSGGL